MIDPNNLPELPQGWVWTKYREICELINGKAFKPTDWAAEGLPIIRIQNLNDINAEFNRCNFPVEEKYLVENGQLLICMVRHTMDIFWSYIFGIGERLFFNQHIFKVMIDENEIKQTIS